MFKLFLISLSILVFSASSFASEKLVITKNNAEIPVTVFKGKDPSKVLLWIPTEYGLHGREDKTASEIARLGPTVWIADLHAAYFIPHGRSSYNNIPLSDITDLISQAGNKQREVIMFATGRAAPIAMKAVRKLQSEKQTRNLVKSAILFHPNFYVRTSEVGREIDYLPITQATNLALYIIQPSLSGKAYQLQTLVELLQKGGSDVMTKLLPDVGDGFNVRESDSPQEAKAYLKTPGIILKGIQLLEHFKRERQPATLPDKKSPDKTPKMAGGLQEYNGNINRLYLDFTDRKNQRHTLTAHKNKVLLLNFWASWCPPCVKELPSLNRLQDKINSGQFEILAINIGEDRETVKKFLQPMNIRFPVLFDPQGRSVKPWNLVAFPSSFVVDKKGTIRYGLFGGIEWDNNDVVTKINNLLQE